MSIIARITVHDIQDICYTKFGRNPEQYHSPADILKSLRTWALKQSMETTGLQYLQHPRSYCHSIVRGSKLGYILCLWRESETMNGNVLFANGSAAVGQSDVSATAAPNGYIAGMPSYYWFTADLRQVCSIGLPHRRAPKSALIDWLKAFMSLRCDLVVSGDEVEEGRWSGSGPKLPDDDGGHPLRATVSFSRVKTEDCSNLFDQLGQVRGVERKETVVGLTKPTSAWWSRVFYKTDDPPRATKIHHMFEVEGLSKAEFERIVDFYMESPDGRLDVGFHMAKGGVQWLSERVLSSRHRLDLPEEDSGVVELKALASELWDRRNEILEGVDTA